MALTIGALSDVAGVPVETVRFYERRGLLPAPPRTPAGYRQYSEVDVWRLGLIARGKALGFTLSEIAALLADGTGAAAASAEEVRRAAAAKIDAVDAQVRDLAEIRAGWSASSPPATRATPPAAPRWPPPAPAPDAPETAVIRDARGRSALRFRSLPQQPKTRQ